MTNSLDIPILDEAALARLHEDEVLVASELPNISNGGIALSVDLETGPDGLAGYRGKKFTHSPMAMASSDDGRLAGRSRCADQGAPAGVGGEFGHAQSRQDCERNKYCKRDKPVCRTKGE